ncbi:hypothetical protein E2W84_25410 [Salmonella enterica]|nr:hypothetical protein [Salmonella enterica]EEB5492615.1 hypothetical protein [Salmonella enterica]
MTDFNAFSDWLWSCDPGLAVRVQDWHAQWRAMLAHHNRYKLKKQTAFTIDGRYRVVVVDEGFALYNLMERSDNEGPMAIYQTPGPMFADLLAHSVRCSGSLSAEAFMEEASRLLIVCWQTWEALAGGGNQ